MQSIAHLSILRPSTLSLASRLTTPTIHVARKASSLASTRPLLQRHLTRILSPQVKYNVIVQSPRAFISTNSKSSLERIPPLPPFRINSSSPILSGESVLGVVMAAIGGLGLYTFINSEGNQALAESETTYTMKSIVPAFAKVQDALKSVGYKEADNYPQIVVVGVQSSGKSSLLEMMVGEEFLPKGEGTVTKRPLILTLHNTSASGKERWAETPDLGGGKITDFSVLEKKILQQNQKLTSTPLRVDIYSPNVVDLRLVDLPGLIHNPTVKQPEDMRTQVKQMVQTYVDNPNTVILAVSPGNSDLQTSEALRFCRKYDRNGERTISVITKLDLVPPEDVQNLVATLSQLPLKLGYVGVKCRSRSDRNSGINLQSAVSIEDEFFANNPYFRRLGFKTGTFALAEELSTMLNHQLEKALPSILDRVRTDLRDTKRKLDILGGPLPATAKEKNELLLKELEKYLKTYLGASTIDDIRTEIAQFIYIAVYQECQKSMPRFAKSYTEQRKKLDKLPENAPVFWEGQEDIRFIRWQEEILSLVDRISHLSDAFTLKAVDLLKTKIGPSSQVLNNRPALQAAIVEMTSKLLNRSHEETADHVRYLVSLEKSISYNSKTLEEKYYQVAKATGAPPNKDEWKKGDFSFRRWTGGAAAAPEGTENPFKSESLKYGKFWTETYLSHMSERLATNIYNALSVEILEQLSSKLHRSFIVELIDSSPLPSNKPTATIDDLLRENSGLEGQRRQLESQISELQKALNTLSGLVTIVGRRQ